MYQISGVKSSSSFLQNCLTVVDSSTSAGQADSLSYVKLNFVSAGLLWFVYKC
ncbi:MAG: hypothetical protein IPH11_13560 [Ignavibacteriales bacterium]|nr:hypothetical protein [Ignavibacteriales bacterium]